MNEVEVQQTAELLKKFQPGFLPYPVFEQIARLVTLPIIEFIPFRVNKGHTEVLLIARDDSDPHWPGMLHTPGTVIRATDLNHKEGDGWAAFQRILYDELKNTKVGSPHYVGSIHHVSKRGTEQAQLYWIEVKEEPKVGNFYPVDNLPEGLIDSQLTFIKGAARHFENFKSTPR